MTMKLLMDGLPLDGGGKMAEVVREERLELSWIAPLDPKSSAYANFATLA